MSTNAGLDAARIAALEGRVVALEARLTDISRRLPRVDRKGNALPLPAADSELDGPRGDVLIRTSPKEMADLRGRNASTLSHDELVDLAAFYAWAAGKDLEDAAKMPVGPDADQKRKWAGYRAQDARLLMGWAVRKEAEERGESTRGVRVPPAPRPERASRRAPAQPAMFAEPGEDDGGEIPF